MSEAKKQYCTFYIEDRFFGIEVLDVQEVLRTQPMTMVPLAPSEIRGLINLRGQIVTAIDLRTRLGMSDRDEDAKPMNVVVRTTGGPVAFLVDEIDDVLEPESELFEDPPATLDASTRSFVSGVYKLDGRLLMVLDTERTADLAA